MATGEAGAAHLGTLSAGSESPDFSGDCLDVGIPDPVTPEVPLKPSAACLEQFDSIATGTTVQVLGCWDWKSSCPFSLPDFIMIYWLGEASRVGGFVYCIQDIRSYIKFSRSEAAKSWICEIWHALEITIQYLNTALRNALTPGAHVVFSLLVSQ